MRHTLISLLIMLSGCSIIPQLAKIEADVEVEGKDIKFDFDVSDVN